MTFIIRDARIDRSLSFTDLETDYFTVHLGGDITTTLRVYSYSPHSEPFSALFEKLGQQTRAWDGELSWTSLEGEFSLKASCDTVGHVFLAIEMVNHTTDFQIQCQLHTDFGQLPLIGEMAAEFFRTTS